MAIVKYAAMSNSGHNILRLPNFFERLLRVGGKNASLGELIKNLSAVGVRVPCGFATTTDAYRRFLTENNLNEKIHSPLPDWTLKNMLELKKTGAEIRAWIYATRCRRIWKTIFVKHMKRWKTLRSPCAHRQRLRIYRTLRLPGSRRVFSTFAAPTP